MGKTSNCNFERAPNYMILYLACHHELVILNARNITQSGNIEHAQSSKLWTYWARANCTILVILTHTGHIERAQNGNLMTVWARVIWHKLVVLSACSLTQTGRIERAQYDNFMTYWARANGHDLVILRARNLTQNSQTERAQNDNFRSQSIARIWPPCTPRCLTHWSILFIGVPCMWKGC